MYLQSGRIVWPNTHFTRGHASLERYDITWEVLIVNNNSMDHIDDVISEYVGCLPLRREFELRAGKSNTLNRAIDVVEGDWTDSEAPDNPNSSGFIDELLRKGWPELDRWLMAIGCCRNSSAGAWGITGCANPTFSTTLTHSCSASIGAERGMLPSKPAARRHPNYPGSLPCTIRLSRMAASQRESPMALRFPNHGRDRRHLL